MQYSQKQNLHTAKAQGSSPQLQRTLLMLLALYAQRCLCNGTVSLRLSVCLSVPPIDQGPCRANDCETVGIPPLMSRKTLGILDGGRGGAVDRARRRRGITGVDKGGA